MESFDKKEPPEKCFQRSYDQNQMDDAIGNVRTSLVNENLRSCDIVIEAIIEDVDTKKSLFSNLGNNAKRTILASNTSSIPIGILAEASGRPGKVIGMHFMNPVPVMKLVELSGKIYK